MHFAAPCTLPPHLLHLSSRPDPTQPIGKRVPLSVALSGASLLHRQHNMRRLKLDETQVNMVLGVDCFNVLKQYYTSEIPENNPNTIRVDDIYEKA